MSIMKYLFVVWFLLIQSSCAVQAGCEFQDKMKLPLFTLARETQQLVIDKNIDKSMKAPWLVESSLQQHPQWYGLFRQCAVTSDVVVTSHQKSYGVVLLCDKNGQRLLFETVDCQLDPVSKAHTDDVPCAVTLDIEKVCP